MLNRRSILLAACAASMLAVPGAAGAATVSFGSSLSAPASRSYAHPVDTAFWPASLPAGVKARAPRRGVVTTIALEGCAKTGVGGAAPRTQMHFQDLRPSGGSSFRVAATSGPFNLPVCGSGGGPSTVSRFHPVNLCVQRGDAVDFNDEGGFAPAGFPKGVPYELFAPLAGASTNTFTKAGATGDGSVLHGRALQGVELLMRVTLSTAHSVCG